MKIIHISPDSQFLQFSARIFEAVAQNCNEYIIFGCASQLKYPPENGRVRVLPSGKRSMARIPSMVRGADAIIAHGLTVHSMIAFLAARSDVVKIWSGWGYDYYGLDANSENELLGEQTHALVRALKLSVQDKKGYRKLISFCVFPLRRAAIRKINIFSAPIPNDYKTMRELFPKYAGDYAQINYGSVESTFAVGGRVSFGNNILVGNSASPTNNHLEVFRILANLDLSGRKIVVPLSYGDPVYREAILREGREMLGDAFVPLVNYMPLQKYVEIIGSCGDVIMNHRRQQALGNIGTALYHGSRVYLNEDSPVYSFLKERKAIIQSIRDLASAGFRIDSLSEEEINSNRQVLEGFWGNDVVLGNVETLVSRIKKARTC